LFTVDPDLVEEEYWQPLVGWLVVLLYYAASSTCVSSVVTERENCSMAR
jgi:hypothetical protein